MIGDWSNSKLKPVGTKLRFFDGSILEPVDEFMTKVELKGKIFDVNFIVVKSLVNPIPSNITELKSFF